MNNLQFLSIGEAMVELSQSEKQDLWRLGIAGDTLNTAWYLRRFLDDNWQVAYFTRVGQGKFSHKLIEFLNAEGILATYITQDPRREIGLYAISLKDGERSFSYWRDNSAARGLADNSETLVRALADTKIAYLSGITLAILPSEGREILLRALANARSAGCQIVFDPNLRPHLWTDLSTMRQWIEAAASHADLIFPSFDDEQQFFEDAGPQTTIKRYLNCGSAQVIVKAGGNPIYYGGAEGDGLVKDLARDVPIDTTSAGDSFNAGYLAARIDGAEIPAAIRRAHEICRIVIRHPGALVREAVTQ